MTGLERNAMPATGPTFFREGDGPMMFQFVIDGGSIIGPRVATKLDMANHVGAYQAFVSLEAAADAEVAPEAPVIPVNRPEPEPKEVDGMFGPGAYPDTALADFDADMKAKLKAEATAFADELGDVLGDEPDGLDAKTDAELRALIHTKTGRWPPPKCLRETLLTKARE